MIPIEAQLTFLMGDANKAVTVPKPFAIARYPVTNAQFRFFVEDGGYSEKWKQCWTKDGLQGWQFKGSVTQPRYWNNDRFNLPNQPVVGISWYEAVAYANWLAATTNKAYRLPMEAEWERAARHTDGRTYPWGNEWQDGFANSKEAGLKRTVPVGIFPGGTAVCGAMDMSGNVREWCQTRWRDENRQEYPPIWQDDGRENLAGDDSIYRVLKGGSYHDNKDNWPRCAFRLRLSPNLRHDYIGFRIVVSPFTSGR
ncbi:MAG: SUMF1/EgtB/PvdO family nonheme iron enzyme [Anaerolineales bacterium]|nr:SUMF1/EgtB/PvdO family nonheme iron enzyme [Anaerolineales bacterium]